MPPMSVGDADVYWHIRNHPGIPLNEFINDYICEGFPLSAISTALVGLLSRGLVLLDSERRLTAVLYE